MASALEGELIVPGKGLLRLAGNRVAIESLRHERMWVMSEMELQRPVLLHEISTINPIGSKKGGIEEMEVRAKMTRSCCCCMPLRFSRPKNTIRLINAN